jgi:hypothetical protein
MVAATWLSQESLVTRLLVVLRDLTYTTTVSDVAVTHERTALHNRGLLHYTFDSPSRLRDSERRRPDNIRTYVIFRREIWSEVPLQNELPLHPKRDKEAGFTPKLAGSPSPK